MEKTILSLNCGSSSLKFNLFVLKENNEVEPVINGIAEEIGNTSRSTMKFVLGEKKNKYEISFDNHETALKEMFNIFEKSNMKTENIVAIGHRVVHGGSIYKHSVLIDEKVKKDIEDLSPVAPLHNPVNLIGIVVAEKLLPGTPNIAVFDTAFHGDIEEQAFRYAIPTKWYEEYLVRRYGFHGTSHLYISRRAAKITNTPYNKFNCITAHLGNGSSIAKINNGKSADTSMGFTPLEGVIMGTRSGDLDPAIISHVANKFAKEENMELGEAYEKVMLMLNKQCGLKGLSGTNLMQDIRAKALDGDLISDTIVDIYAYRIAKYIGSYMATSSSCKAIIFTAGVGENEWYVRQKVLQKLKGFKFVIDNEKNKIRGEEVQIAIGQYNGEQVKVFVLPTDEEVVIAYDTLYLGYLKQDIPKVYPFEK